MRVQALKNDELSERLARLEVCGLRDRDERRKRDGNCHSNRRNERDDHDRDGSRHMYLEDREDDITRKVKLVAPTFDGVHNPRFFSD